MRVFAAVISSIVLDHREPRTPNPAVEIEPTRLKTDIAASTRHALPKSRRAFYVVSMHDARGLKPFSPIVWPHRARSGIMR